MITQSSVKYVIVPKASQVGDVAMFVKCYAAKQIAEEQFPGQVLLSTLGVKALDAAGDSHLKFSYISHVGFETQATMLAYILATSDIMAWESASNSAIKWGDSEN